MAGGGAEAVGACGGPSFRGRLLQPAASSIPAKMNPTPIPRMRFP